MDNINLDTLDTEFEKAVNSSKVHDSLSFHSVKFMEDIYVKYRIFFLFFFACMGMYIFDAYVFMNK